MKRSLPFILCALLVTLSCGRERQNAREGEEEAVEIADMTMSASRWADSLCSTLTLRQKVAQLFMPAIFASDDLWTMRLLKEYADSCLGGIVLLKGDAESAAALADSLSLRSKVSPFVAIDAEWGLAMRLADAPEFPANNEISPDVDDQLMYDYGYELARECRLIGINMVLGPVVDVSTVNSFMRRRSYGDDPVRVANLALAYARGLEDGNVISVAKHFPGHGSVSVDSHKRKGVIERSLHEMDSIDLYPFKKWVEQRLTGVMVGHLAVPSIDSEMKPAAVSKTVIEDLLRTDLAFSGLILTDALNMKGAQGYDASDAVGAGADIVVAPTKTDLEIQNIMDAVAQGKITEEMIDDHVKRILFYKYFISQKEAGHKGSLRQLDSAVADTISQKLVD